jgi:hypothetical protein
MIDHFLFFLLTVDSVDDLQLPWEVFQVLGVSDFGRDNGYRSDVIFMNDRERFTKFQFNFLNICQNFDFFVHYPAVAKDFVLKLSGGQTQTEAVWQIIVNVFGQPYTELTNLTFANLTMVENCLLRPFERAFLVSEPDVRSAGPRNRPIKLNHLREVTEIPYSRP